MTRRLVAWTGLVSALAAVNYVGRATSGNPARDSLYHYSVAAGNFAAYVVIFALLLWIVAGRYELFALRRLHARKRALKYMTGILVATYVVVAALEPVLHAGREQGITPPRWEPGHAGAYAANFVVIAVVAPVVEELLFRGAGYSLLERFGRWPAIVLVGVAFALSHGLVQGLPPLVFFGSALAWLRSKTASVYPGMAVHAVFNGVQLVLAVTL